VLIKKAIVSSAVYLLLFTSCKLFVIEPYDVQYYKDRVIAFSKEPVAAGRIIFLGNSITERGDWKQLTGDTTVINRGISGDNTTGVLRRLDDIILRRPSKLFILIGINDISKEIPDADIADNYRKIITQVTAGSPGTVIYFQSLLPVNNLAKGFALRYDKQPHIVSTNLLLKQLCASMNITYVDLYPMFLNAEQKLDLKYTTDGLHLTEAAYRKWVGFLKEQVFL
jgi:lysophospholipase L1-like esterase